MAEAGALEEADRVRSLGRAITALGLEKKFLGNGALGNFPLVQRGMLAKEIVSEGLERGRWQGVIQMIYGGLGKVDVLYEGDKNQLKEDIVKSALAHPREQTYIESEVIGALLSKKEYGLLFALATNIHSISYEHLQDLARNFPEEFLDDTKTKTLETLLGRKALKGNQVEAAFYHFRAVGDMQKIGEIFEKVIAEKRGYPKHILEEMATADETQKEDRLKKLVLAVTRKRMGITAVEAYEIIKIHKVELTDEERKRLYAKLAKTAGTSDIARNIFKKEGEVELAWAKLHAKSEPKVAYNIFIQQKYEGKEVLTAVQAGLAQDSWEPKNKSTALSPTDVLSEHLRGIYQRAPFKTKTKIATHLKDNEELQKLSRKALRKKELDEAYRLWVAGSGDLNSEYIQKVRARIIKDSIAKENMYLRFNVKDIPGNIQAFESLMEAERSNKDWLPRAYELAAEIGDETKTQQAREQMVAVNPRWAFEIFSRGSRKDEAGINYAVEVIAGRCGIPAKQLSDYVKKYSEKR